MSPIRILPLSAPPKPVDMMSGHTGTCSSLKVGDGLSGPVAVEDGGTTACRAEWAFGAEADHAHCVCFLAGTRIGGGIVLNGSVSRGCLAYSGGFGPLRVPEAPGGTRLIDHASLVTLERLLERI